MWTLIGVTLVVAFGVGCTQRRGDKVPSSALPKLHDVASIAEFQARFDADSALPRLVLLLSPT